jgi:hypothetical protein
VAFPWISNIQESWQHHFSNITGITRGTVTGNSSRWWQIGHYVTVLCERTNFDRHYMWKNKLWQTWVKTGFKLPVCLHAKHPYTILWHSVLFAITLVYLILERVHELYITLAWHIQLFGLTTLRINCAYAVIQKSLRLPLGLRILRIYCLNIHFVHEYSLIYLLVNKKISGIVFRTWEKKSSPLKKIKQR